MGTRARRVVRAVLILGAVLVALELVYLVAGNLILWTGGVARILSGNPDAMFVQHGRAYTVLPGRVQVTDFLVRVQDAHTQFQLTVEHAQVDIDLPSLLLKRFHSRQVQCEGLRFRFRYKVDDPEGMEQRAASYPPVPGFAAPFNPRASQPPEVSQRKSVPWSVRFDDIRAQVKDLWVLEHRWEGEGHAEGGFQLMQMRTLEVWPSRLTADHGQLRAGKFVVSEAPRFQVNAKVASCDVHDLKGATVFRPITGGLTLEARRFSPALLELYFPGLTARGSGTLTAQLRIEAGRFSPDLRAELQMDSARLAKQGFVYEGGPRLVASFDTPASPVAAGEAALPRIHVTVPGSLVVPVPDGGAARVQLGGVQGDVTLSSRDIAGGIALKEVAARIQEGRVADAAPVRAAIAAKATFVVAAALGNGPLLLSGGVDHRAEERAEVTIVRLGSAHLGLAELHGAARTAEGGWNGAAAGQVGPLHFGLHLKAGKIEVTLTASDAWLDQALADAGIRFER